MLVKVFDCQLKRGKSELISISFRTSNNHGICTLYVEAHREQVWILREEFLHVCLMNSLLQQAKCMMLSDELMH